MLNKLRTVPVILFLFVAACATFNPFEAAVTLEQKAFASYGTFVSYQETAVGLMSSPNVPDNVKAIIQRIDGIAKPAADLMQAAAVKVIQVRLELEATPDATTLDKLNIAIAALNEAYNDAGPKIDALRLAIDN